LGGALHFESIGLARLWRGGTIGRFFGAGLFLLGSIVASTIIAAALLILVTDGLILFVPIFLIPVALLGITFGAFLGLGIIGFIDVFNSRLLNAGVLFALSIMLLAITGGILGTFIAPIIGTIALAIAGIIVGGASCALITLLATIAKKSTTVYHLLSEAIITITLMSLIGTLCGSFFTPGGAFLGACLGGFAGGLLYLPLFELQVEKNSINKNINITNVYSNNTLGKNNSLEHVPDNDLDNTGYSKIVKTNTPDNCNEDDNINIELTN
jgi:hypothetical protein